MPSTFPYKSALFIVISALSVMAACSAGSANNMSVSTTHAVRQDLSAWISSNGKVEPVEPYAVQAQLTSFVQSVSVSQGATVQRGQLLMTLDAKDLQTELARLRGELLTAEDERRTAAEGGPADELAQLQSDLARTESEIARLRREGEALDRLYAKQAATRQEIDQNKAALERAEADRRLLEQKRKALAGRSNVQAERSGLRAEEVRSAIRGIQDKINSARVTAPGAGTIFSLAARPGMYVRTGDVLAELADLTRIRVRAFVDEPEVGLLKEGQPVEVSWEGLPNRTWTGQVEQLPKTIVARGSRNVGEVLCAVANTESELLPNTNVDVRIRTADRPNALTLPRSAVRTEAKQYYVFVVQEGRLRKRNVSVGVSNSTHFEIVSGINENDVVALPGAAELQDGASVTVS